MWRLNEQHQFLNYATPFPSATLSPLSFPRGVPGSNSIAALV